MCTKYVHGASHFMVCIEFLLKETKEVDAHYQLKTKPLLQAGLCIYVSP